VKILNPAKVKMIEELLEKGTSFVEIRKKIGKKFETSVSNTTVTKIRRRLFKNIYENLLSQDVENLKKEIEQLKKEMRSVVEAIGKLQRVRR